MPAPMMHTSVCRSVVRVGKVGSEVKGCLCTQTGSVAPEVSMVCSAGEGMVAVVVVEASLGGVSGVVLVADMGGTCREVGIVGMAEVAVRAVERAGVVILAVWGPER